MRRLAFAFALLAFASGIRADEVQVPRGPLPAGLVPEHYRLTITVDPRKARFSGQAEIEVMLAAPTRSIWLHGLGLHVRQATVTSGRRRLLARYEEVDRDFGVARLALPATLPAGRATLAFHYDAPFQTAPQGLYRTRAGRDWYVYSQMEAIDARRAFPGFDEPRFKTPFDVVVIANSKDRVVANTPETRTIALQGHKLRHEFLTTRPLPTYLLAFAVGPFDIVEGPPIPANAVRSTPLPLRIVTTRGQAARAAFTLRETPALVRGLEEYFGIAFPYPKLDLIASPIHPGAMENAGAILFADTLLLFEGAPTPRQQSDFGNVTAHELAHQWFGDLVTPAWWDDIWLNESFAQWMGGRIADAWRPQLGIGKEQLDGTLGAMHTDALSAGRPIHQPIKDNAAIGSSFDGITYQKGAGVLGMIESYLGEARFQGGVRLHLNRHRDGTATADEFFAAMAEGSGDASIVEAFRSFVDTPGLPFVTISASADGRTLALAQSRYRPLGASAGADPLWKIPLCISAIDAAQASKLCTLLAGRSGSLTLPAGTPGGVVIHPNANGAGYYRFALDAPTLRSLLEVGPRLPAREAIVLADSVAAAFEAGQLSFGELLSAASVLATHPDRTASLSLGYALADIHDRLADAAQRPAIERRLIALYGPRLRAMGYDTTVGHYAGEPAEQQLQRRELFGLVGINGRDPELSRALAPAAERSLADPSTLDPLLRRRIWSIGARDLGAPFSTGLAQLLLTTDDSQIRRDAAIGLAYAESPSPAEEALTLALNPRVDLGAAFGIIGQQLGNPRTRAAAWSWLAARQDAVVERVPAMFQGYLAQLGSNFCSDEERAQFDALLGARLAHVSGGEIELARVHERIGDCIALRSARGADVSAALAAP